MRGIASPLLFALLALVLRPRVAMAGEGAGAAPDVPEFWPEVKDDLVQVTWAHAVNSRKELDNALQGEAMMLEADVSLAEDKTPIMAHPPSTSSDLTLHDFIDSLASSGKRKGAKLDFKTTAAFEEALPVLAAAEAQSKLRFPLWLNADIAAGPGGAAQPDVSAARFLSACAERFPERTLSLGWTTGDAAERYSEAHVRAMEDALASANVSMGAITFAVRAKPAARSQDALLPLLSARPDATFTIWGAKQDQVDNQALVQFAKEAGFRRVYVDLPHAVPGLTPGSPMPGDPASPADAPSTAPTSAGGGRAGSEAGGGALPAAGTQSGVARLTWAPLAVLAMAIATALRRF